MNTVKPKNIWLPVLQYEGIWTTLFIYSKGQKEKSGMQKYFVK